MCGGEEKGGGVGVREEVGLREEGRCEGRSVWGVGGGRVGDGGEGRRGREVGGEGRRGGG